MATLARVLGAANPFDIGQSPYDIQGNAVVALIAQINRFAGKTFDCPHSRAGTSSSMRVLSEPLPLTPTISEPVAYAAAQLIRARYACVSIDFYSDSKLGWVQQALQSGNLIGWVGANVVELTTTIAAYGDSFGYPAASVGITTRDEKLLPKGPGVVTMLSVGTIFTIIGAALSTWRKL